MEINQGVGLGTKDVIEVVLGKWNDKRLGWGWCSCGGLGNEVYQDNYDGEWGLVGDGWGGDEMGEGVEKR